MTFIATLDPKIFGGLKWKSTTHHARWRDFVKEKAGQEVRIEIPTPVRSDSQNRFYWTYLGIVEKETGNNAADLHEYFKRVLLPPVFTKVTIQGKEIEVKTPRSTTTLSKLEFVEYLDKISAMTGVPVPSPAEAGYITNY